MYIILYFPAIEVTNTPPLEFEATLFFENVVSYSKSLMNNYIINFLSIIMSLTN